MDAADDANEAHTPRVAVFADPPGDAQLVKRADALGRQLQLTLIREPEQLTGFDLLLTVTAARLELRVLRGQSQGGLPLWANLSAIDTTSPAGRSLKQPLIKAIGIRKRADAAGLSVIDTTAGWGEDAWLLASFGCQVLAIERHSIIAALLADALERAGEDDPQTRERVHLIAGNARELIQSLREHAAESEAAPFARFDPPDVVYLDPMFPSGRKTAERKPMRVLRQLVGTDDDAPALLDAALQVAARRVVVKRPLHAPDLGSCPPDLRFRGKALRFDVYLPARSR